LQTDPVVFVLDLVIVY